MCDTVERVISQCLRPARGAPHLSDDGVGRLPSAGALAVADQAIVSITTFATSVVVGRMAGAAALGAFSLVMSITVVLAGIQETLITIPYTVRWRQLDPPASQALKSSVAVHSVALGAAAGITAAVSAAVLPIDGGLSYVLPAALPILLMKELVRRLLFAHLHLWTAVAMDAASAVLQFAGLAGLAWADALSLQAVLAVMALAPVAPVLAGGAAAGVLRKAPDAEVILGELRANVRFGLPALGSRVVGYLNSDILLVWALTVARGSAATGIFAACVAVVGLANPVLLAAGSIMTALVARARAASGIAGVRRMLATATPVLGAAMAVFALVIMFFGGTALTILYGPSFAQLSAVAVLLAGAVFVSAIAIPAGHALLVLERPDLNFKASLLGLGVTAIGSLAIAEYGLAGAAGALLAGQSADAFVRLALAYRLTSGR